MPQPGSNKQTLSTHQQTTTSSSQQPPPQPQSTPVTQQQHRNNAPQQPVVSHSTPSPSSTHQRGQGHKERSEKKQQRSEWVGHKVSYLLSTGERVEGDVVDYDPLSQTIVLFRMYSIMVAVL